ncbi:ATP-binding protein [Paenibacillus sp. NEAU-GSW1]|uniref:ATP-binding protein n=1 Tax=Paenibacillus sp. NEAU-GSW1 TaxID=2682486 RepID=UPI0012E2DA93|nr:ATP-binding protein [Paenibacillus sp. NEAU-GSW1]MUT66508.1 response regulator [Paenibacillus sp. NEAU-GSW1]
MRAASFAKLTGILLIFIITVSAVFLFYKNMESGHGAPIAKAGKLDLSGWDFAREGAVSLNGEWEFYEGRLLEPDDFRKGNAAGAEAGEASYLKVPGAWLGKSGGSGMSAKGYGTYRLVVSLKKPDEIMALKISSIRMSHRLYVNGRLEGENGKPDAFLAEHLPGNTPYSTAFLLDSNEMEIVIQTANHVFASGGIASAISFGRDGDIATLDGLKQGADFAVIFVLFLFGSYHLSISMIRIREKTNLYSGLYMWTLFINLLTYGEKIGLRLAPDLPFEFVYRVQNLTEFLSIVWLVLFFNAIDSRLLPLRKLMIAIAPVLAFIAAILLLPYAVYSAIKVYFLLYMFVVVLAIIARLAIQYVKKAGDSHYRKEMVMFIGAAGSLQFYLVSGLLYAVNAVQTDFGIKAGIVCFIMFLNVLLAYRYTAAFEKTELLSNRLSVANELKNEFLANTSHELKTPLHGIMNMASHLLEDGEGAFSAKQQQHLWLIRDTSTKMSLLIEDLIDVTQIRNGELRLQPSVVNVRMVAQIVVDVLRFELTGKAVALTNDVDAGTWVIADENRLRQIMYNLVHNAIKHTERGVISVTSGTSQDHVYLSVEDTGTGIEKERFEAIFNEYHYMDAAKPLQQDGYAGMGIGLYITRKLVERMGGTIGVAWSQIGQGSRMTFTLPSAAPPLGAVEASAAGERPAAADLSIVDHIDKHAYTILIVDDDSSNIYMLLAILHRGPYNVITAFSAEEAIRKFEEMSDSIDLVISDVMMPAVSGYDLCRMLRRRRSVLDLPILLATVRNTPQDIAMGFGAGANDYITKPFDAETLLARVQTLIAMKRSIQEAIRNEHAFHQAQIKPHFLYNALSSVISICYSDGVKAAHLLSMLSQYLRHILDMDHDSLLVPLHHELDLIHAYVEIEKARFDSRLEWDFYVDPSLQEKLIPSLCIQPFIENAIRHGLFEKDGDGKVLLSIEEGAGFLKIVVSDDGVGIPDDLLYRFTSGSDMGSGIGISNIRKRLAAIPGSSLTIVSELGSGTTVTMYVPLNLTVGAGQGKGVKFHV